MEVDIQNHTDSESGVSCFKLDGVVAEMVIEVDEEHESPHKALKLDSFQKSNNTSLENSSKNENSESNSNLETEDSTSPSGKSEEQSMQAKGETSSDLKDSNTSEEKDPPFLGVDMETKKVSKKLDYSSEEYSVTDSIISDLDRISKATKMIEESKDEIMRVAKLIEESKESEPSSESKSHEVVTPKSVRQKKSNAFKKGMSASKSDELNAEQLGKSLENLIPTAISTRGNKRKLADIEQETSEPLIPASKIRKTSIGKSKSPLMVLTGKKSLRKKTGISLAASKPREFDLFAGDTRLERFAHFKSSLNEANLKNQRNFYRLLFDKWAPNDEDQMKMEILQFKGFDFDKDSKEVEKRRYILKKLPEQGVSEICKMLDLKVQNKVDMISSTLKFLLKPTKKVISVVDPNLLSMQPFVKLEKLSFANTYLFESSKSDSTDVKPSRAILKKKSLPPDVVTPVSSTKKKAPVTKDKTPASETKKKGPASKVGTPILATKKKTTLIKKETSSPGTKNKSLSAKIVTPLSAPKKKSLVPKKETPVPTKPKKKLGPQTQTPILANESKTISPKVETPISATKNKETFGKNDPIIITTKRKPKPTKKAALLKKPKMMTANVLAVVKVKPTVTPKRKIPVPETSDSDSETEMPISPIFEEEPLVIEEEIHNPIVESASGDEDENMDVSFESKVGIQNKKKDVTSTEEESTSVVRPQESSKVKSTLTVKATARKRTSKSQSLNKQAMREKIKNLKMEIVKLRRKVKESESSSKPKQSVENGAIIPTLEKKVRKEDLEDYKPIGFPPAEIPILETPKIEKVSDSESSEVTLSADEMPGPVKKERARKKKLFRRGKALGTFKNIRESIFNGNFNALQRLHILLFGASDKVDNLKTNILAFGGFPFLEGSDHWKQKEFLLSLLGLKTLKEYLDLLCIQYTNDEDQQTLISKLMKFLARPNDPSEKSSAEIYEPEIKIEVDHSELVLPIIQTAESLVSKKKMKKLPENKPKPAGRIRKVLMDETQARRMEADIAREQRIIEREKRYNQIMVIPPNAAKTPLGTTVYKPTLPVVKTIPTPPVLKTIPTPSVATKQSDADQLNALLQTVYKRRALKAVGAVISIPNKAISTKLGELPNVKFLVVTANFSDLDVLHHLIYMVDGVKSKVRKNILDFSGFGFNEDSDSYKERMDLLNSFGYERSKRIAFLLGLCPFKTDIPQLDLNELIMYFLMSPCKTKQVPITHLPQTFFSKNMPEELCLLLQKHGGDLEAAGVKDPQSKPRSLSVSKQNEIKNKYQKKPSTATQPVPPNPLPSRQKAKKSFKSSCLPPAKKMALSPSISTIPFKSAVPIQKPAADVIPHVNVPAPALQKALLQAAAPFASSASTPQEFLVQQQTPDGKQKTYKLIKLPASHPLTSALRPPGPPSPLSSPALPTQPVSFNSPLATLPPGIIIFKNKTDPPLPISSAVPNVLQSVPLILGQPQPNLTSSFILPNTGTSTAVSSKEEEEPVIPEDTAEKLDDESDDVDEDLDIIKPLNRAPTGDEIYSSIQEIIHNANFEDITLRNVIDRVAAQYSDFDLRSRHTFMKECVKKIIMGT